MFQSSPDPEARCNSSPDFRLSSARPCFNPHRTQRPGATRRRGFNRIALLSFQSSPDPEARCNWWSVVAQSSPGGFQSSPDPEARCNGVKLTKSPQRA